MTNRKSTRRALTLSVISLLLCVAMLVGTTYAWFTDSVTSGNNRIVSGTLDVELEYLADGKWEKVTEQTNVFKNGALWEPGYTEVVYLKVSNVGNLALKYLLGVNVASESGSVNKAGDPFKLSEHIEYDVIEDVTVPYTSREEARKAAKDDTANAPARLAANYNKSGALLPEAEKYVALVVYMPEEIGNEANYDKAYDAPVINLGVSVVATQEAYENDSFGNDYDATSIFPDGTVNISIDKSVQGYAANGAIVEPLTIGNTDTIAAEIPAGVQLADGVDTLTFAVQTLEDSKANVTLQNGEAKTSLNVHVEGIHENNTVPMLITIDELLPVGMNLSNIALYHVEDGNTVAMTQVAAPVNHNEYSYDPLTGNVTMTLASFSEVAVVADTTNSWDGSAATAFAGGEGKEADPYLIANAQQLAYFRNEVDGGNSFAGKFVKLNNDINLGGGKNFDPIGYGYSSTDYMTGGKSFMGTFDGDGNSIYGLTQSGWDMEAATGTDYTYSMAGAGLFSSVTNATIKNLIIGGAYIRMECVEMGFVAGHAEGNCTFENIQVYDSKIANYQRATGGIVGEVAPVFAGEATQACTHTFKDIVVGSSVVVGTLWGDFDAPVGGVIGARWDDADVSEVVMKNVTVACKLDVYNDVTSSYQWHAYRRAGMLIGNTDTPPADGKNAKTAEAKFLHCTNVNVYYTPWVNYHYCEFNKYNSSWPWVRVEAGENCNAYSNPRWGTPKDELGNNKIVDAAHDSEHKAGEGHYVLEQFNQLYGGGQGVYGQSEHPNVTVSNIAYTITFVSENEVVGVDYVSSNETAYTISRTASASDKTFYKWATVAGVVKESIEAGNTENITLFATWENLHTARFVDHNNNLLFSGEFTPGNGVMKNNINPSAFNYEEGDFKYTYDHYKELTKGAAGDVVVGPLQTYKGNLRLTPHYDDYGKLIYYSVEAVKNLSGKVTVPGYVNNVPVKVITDLCNDTVNGLFSNGITAIEIKDGVEEIGGDAFAMTIDLEEITIPHSVKKVGTNAFSSNAGSYFLKTVTINYRGTWAEWQAACNTDTSTDTGWDNGLYGGSKVVCTDGTYVLNARYGDTNHTWGDWKKQ